MTHRLRHLALVTLAAALLWPAAGAAHDFDPERQVLVQVFPTHLDIVISYTEAPGPRSQLFLSQFFPEASDALHHLAARAILPRLLDGLQFEVHGESPRTGEPEVGLRDLGGRLAAAAFIRYDLDDLPEEATRTITVRAADRSFLLTDVLIYPGGELQRTDATPEPARLRRAGELQATFSR
jgi:hypothetical protein